MTLRHNEWEYDFPLDINEADVNGQTALYLACCVGNVKIVDLILNLKVRICLFCDQL